MPSLTDDDGRRWFAERVGRTSGMISTGRGAGKGRGEFPEPADIIRFRCESDQDEDAREVTTKTGLLEQLTEAELLALWKTASKAL